MILLAIPCAIILGIFLEFKSFFIELFQELFTAIKEAWIESKNMEATKNNLSIETTRNVDDMAIVEDADFTTAPVEKIEKIKYMLPQAELLSKSVVDKKADNNYVDVLTVILKEEKIDIQDVTVDDTLMTYKIFFKSCFIKDTVLRKVLTKIKWKLGSDEIFIRKHTEAEKYCFEIKRNQDNNFICLGNIAKKTSEHIPLFFGVDEEDNVIVKDMVETNHLLIAGQTGSGKSVCLLSIVNGLLLNKTPDELKLIMIDYKGTELNLFKNIPHLACPIQTTKYGAMNSLYWLVDLMKDRYSLLKRNDYQNLEDYNKENEPLPYFVCIIDEVANLISDKRKEFDELLEKLSSMSRAAGIYLIVSTQRPDSKTISSTLKANMTTKVAFKVASGVNSRIILDANGAEKLRGKGDCLLNCNGNITHLQVANTTKEDIKSVVEAIKVQGNNKQYDSELMAILENGFEA